MEATGDNNVGLATGEWERYFQHAKVATDKLNNDKSTKSKATTMGTFLARNVDREIPIEVRGRIGKATLRKVEGRSRKVRYHFEIVWDDVVEGARPDQVPPATSRPHATAPMPARSEPQPPVEAVAPREGVEGSRDLSDETGNSEPW